MSLPIRTPPIRPKNPPEKDRSAKESKSTKIGVHIARESVLRNHKKCQVVAQRIHHHKEPHFPLGSRNRSVLQFGDWKERNPLGQNQCTLVFMGVGLSLGQFRSWHNADIIKYHKGKFSQEFIIKWSHFLLNSIRN